MLIVYGWPGLAESSKNRHFYYLIKQSANLIRDLVKEVYSDKSNKLIAP